MCDMASYRKRQQSWQAIVRKLGHHEVRTFPSKAQAVSWATQLESEILSGKFNAASDKTVGQLLDEYTKRLKQDRWNLNRIALLRNQVIEVDGQSYSIHAIKLSDLNERHVSAWRDMRRSQVSGSSVNREWNILSGAFTVAMREWKWIHSNPFHSVKRPEKNPARDRLATGDEIDRLINSAGYSEKTPPSTLAARSMAMWLFAAQTGMRLKEICALKWDMVDVIARTAQVTEDSKTGAREVPLSSRAVQIIEQCRPLKLESVFGMTVTQTDANWRKVKSKAQVDDLTFHDAKHYACTWMADKVQVFDLARIVGTRDLKTLMIYYNKKAKDIALSLD